MSQPESGFRRQGRRHWGPIAGIAAAIVFVLALMLWLAGSADDAGPAPDGPPPAAPVPQPAPAVAPPAPADGLPAD